MTQEVRTQDGLNILIQKVCFFFTKNSNFAHRFGEVGFISASWRTVHGEVAQMVRAQDS